jgi:hypothetical protein
LGGFGGVGGSPVDQPGLSGRPGSIIIRYPS